MARRIWLVLSTQSLLSFELLAELQTGLLPLLGTLGESTRRSLGEPCGDGVEVFRPVSDASFLENCEPRRRSKPRFLSTGLDCGVTSLESG